jgi:hypothetical protein
LTYQKSSNQSESIKKRKLAIKKQANKTKKQNFFEDSKSHTHVQGHPTATCMALTTYYNTPYSIHKFISWQWVEVNVNQQTY